MKIATWNVNSIRARLPRLQEYLQTRQPDVVCLQELKCTGAQFPAAAIEALGYRCETFGQKTYNGVALLSKQPIAGVVRNMGDDDEQARLIAGTVGEVTVVSLYAPNGQSVDSPAYQYKLQWYRRLNLWLGTLETKGFVLCGDYNIAPEPIDTWDAELWEGQTLFTPRERAALEAVKQRHQLVDVFRQHHPGEPGRFSWWDYRAGAFHKNQGLRLDSLLASQSLAPRCTAADIDREMRKGPTPSDHAPVWAVFELETRPDVVDGWQDVVAAHSHAVGEAVSPRDDH